MNFGSQNKASSIDRRFNEGRYHHPIAILIFRLLKEADEQCGDNYFDWKSGGAGDNGEILMYELSEYLEFSDNSFSFISGVVNWTKESSYDDWLKSFSKENHYEDNDSFQYGIKLDSNGEEY